MPATITHAYFAEDLYNRFPRSTKKRINHNKKQLMMFSQGTDPLMFYNIYSIMPGKRYRTLQMTSHTINTNLFFSSVINYMKDNYYYKDPTSLCFLYGFIAHFCLDSNTHPYIFYRTGDFKKEYSSTYKYKGLHTYMETYIDNYYLKIRNNSKLVNLDKFCFKKKHFSKELNNILDYSFKTTFNENNLSKVYYKSLKQMKVFMKLFMFDKTGIKKKLYQVIDIFTKGTTFPFKSLSYKLDNYDHLDYLNNNHNKWCYPVNKDISSTKSFKELYEDSLNESIYIINQVNNFFFNNKKIDINKLFKNKSYRTGCDCSVPENQIFFEF